MREPAVLLGYCESCNPPGGRVVVVEIFGRRGQAHRYCLNCLRKAVEAGERKVKEYKGL